MWAGGTFEAYVNGGDADEMTQIRFTGTLTLSAGSHLHLNVIGNLTSNLAWKPLMGAAPTARIVDGLTFDSGDLFTVQYRRDMNPWVQVTAR